MTIIAQDDHLTAGAWAACGIQRKYCSYGSKYDLMARWRSKKDKKKNGLSHNVTIFAETRQLLPVRKL